MIPYTLLHDKTLPKSPLIEATLAFLSHGSKPLIIELPTPLALIPQLCQTTTWSHPHESYPYRFTIPRDTISSAITLNIIDDNDLDIIPSLIRRLTTDPTCFDHILECPNGLFSQDNLTKRASPKGLTHLIVAKRVSPKLYSPPGITRNRGLYKPKTFP